LNYLKARKWRRNKKKSKESMKITINSKLKSKRKLRQITLLSMLSKKWQHEEWVLNTTFRKIVETLMVITMQWAVFSHKNHRVKIILIITSRSTTKTNLVSFTTSLSQPNQQHIRIQPVTTKACLQSFPTIKTWAWTC
jgi:hypothetical protein